MFEKPAETTLADRFSVFRQFSFTKNTVLLPLSCFPMLLNNYPAAVLGTEDAYSYTCKRSIRRSFFIAICSPGLKDLTFTVFIMALEDVLWGSQQHLGALAALQGDHDYGIWGLLPLMSIADDV